MENNSSNPTSSTPVPSIDQPIHTPLNQSQQIKKASKFSIKAIIGTIIFLLVAGGAAASFVYREPLIHLVSKPDVSPTETNIPTPTPDPTVNWKLYTGEGFTFKYPPDFTYSKENESEKENEMIVVFQNNDSKFSVHVIPDNLKGTNESKLKQVSVDSINGITWVLYPENENCDTENCEIKSKSYQTGYDGRYFTFYLLSTEDDFIKQVISTFKLTSPDDFNTKDWRTYINSNCGYQIQYPDYIQSPVFMKHPGGRVPEDEITYFQYASKKVGFSQDALYISTNPHSQDYDIDYWKTLEEKYSKNKEFEYIMIDGIKALKITYENSTSNQEMNIHFTNDVCDFTIGTDSKKDSVSIANQLISTLKFLK